VKMGRWSQIRRTSTMMLTKSSMAPMHQTMMAIRANRWTMSNESR
jgi:hypothetical protein